MSLDVYLIEIKRVEVFEANVTHNLTTMAEAAGLYQCCWRPEEIGITKAYQLIDPLRQGLKKLEADPEHYKGFNPKNNWGTYDGFVRWVRSYLLACEDHPDADVKVSR